MAAMHLGRDTAGYHHGPEGVGGGAGSNHAGSGSHDRVVVLVAEPLTTRPGRRRLGSASLAAHLADLPTTWKWCRQHRLGNNYTIAPSPSRCQPGGVSCGVEIASATRPTAPTLLEKGRNDAAAHAAVSQSTRSTSTTEIA